MLTDDGRTTGACIHVLKANQGSGELITAYMYILRYGSTASFNRD